MNCDLCKTSFELVFQKAIILTVRWMPSHLLEFPPKGVYSGVSLLDILGNARADTLPDNAAKAANVSLNVSAPVIYSPNLVKISSIES